MKPLRQQQDTSPAQVYEDYFVPGIHARWAPVLLGHAKPRPGERMLDVACGTGIVARRAAPLVGPEGAVTGLDINSDMLAVAREQPSPEGAAIDWQERDASVALPDGPFDLVVCQQGLQFFSDRAAAVRGMRRVLASGGRAVVSVFQCLAHHPLYEALIEAEARYLGTSVEAVATPFSLGSADELHSLFRSAGFRGVEVIAESQEVRFPEPERFVALTLLAAASIITEAEMDAETRSGLVQTVSREVDATLRKYVKGDTVAFPMHAHVAIAQS